MDCSIKFALQKKSGVEMRRVRGAYTLAELQSVVGQWWGCPNLRWQYRDPEGDMVTMTTEPEWVECVRLAGPTTSATPIRITILKAVKASPPVACVPVDPLPAMVAAAVDNNNNDVCERASGAAPAAVPTCRSGCKLTPHKSASWQCDVCDGHGSVSMACRSCNFDMCEACYARPVDAVPVTVVAAAVEATASIDFPGHGCPVVDTDLRGLRGYGEFGRFRCDVCGRKGTGRSFHCGRCSYDVCDACMAAFQEAVHTQEAVTPLVSKAMPVVTLPALVLFPVVANVPAVVTVVPAAAVTAVSSVPAAITTEMDPKCATLMAVFPSLDAATAAEILGLANGNVRTAIEMFLGA